MVEAPSTQYQFALRILRLLASLTAGGSIGQAISFLIVHHSLEDSQAAGMLAHLLMQHLSYYFLGCGFVILSLSNLLIKRGISGLKAIRLPTLISISSIAIASYLFIPRMDYLRETALQDGMPVILSPYAGYFFVINSLTLFLLCVQIVSSAVIAWRLNDPNLA